MAPVAQDLLDEVVRSEYGPDSVAEFEVIIAGLVAKFAPSRTLEIGGGRTPRSLTEVLGLEVVVNDISEEELAHLPPHVSTLCMDISNPAAVPASYEGSFDFVFSRSVLEHVDSVDLSMESTHKLLADGGVALHYFPTLYSSPFVINKVIPFRLTKPIVDRIRRPQITRFPAVYRGTRSTERLGFREVAVHRFYGHNYYDRIPVLRTIDRWLSVRARSRGWYWYSSYAFVVLVK
jgi:SAM-dependent methyltransferase